MTLDTIIMLLGTIVAVTPFLGLPPMMQDILFFLLGVAIISLGVAVRRKGPDALKSVQPIQSRNSDFVESVPHHDQIDHPIEEESMDVEHDEQQ